MRQVWIPRTGTPDVLEVRTAPDPQPGQGEIRIRVKATGVNFADVLARMGLYPDAPKLPCVVGYEVAGDVDAVGPGVTGFQVGDRVVSLTRFGGYSDVVVVPSTLAAPLPEALTYETAAALPVNWLTAWLMLVKLGNVQKGDRVLVHAAAGGVGQAAIQIARWRGATVIGTASASKHARLRESGVEHCIDYTTQNVEQAVKAYTGGKGVDIVLDAVGGDSFKQSYASLAPMGRLFMFGVSSFAPGKSRNLIAAARGLFAMPKFAPIPLMNENRGVFGVNLGHLWEQADALKAMLAEIVALTADGTFTPVIDRTFPFDQAAEAHRFLQDRKNFGKVLLVPLASETSSRTDSNRPTDAPTESDAQLDWADVKGLANFTMTAVDEQTDYIIRPEGRPRKPFSFAEMMKPDFIESRMKAVKLPQGQAMAQLARTSIRMESQQTTPDNLRLGESRLGGAPDLPPGFEWPSRNGHPLTFLAQIALEDATRGSVTELPSDGWLLFFYDALEMPWGGELTDIDSAVVIHLKASAEDLQRVEHPEVDEVAGPFFLSAVTFRQTIDLPYPVDCLAKSWFFSLSSKLRDAYWQLLMEMSGVASDSTDHHLLGHPQLVQGDLRQISQLNGNGLEWADGFPPKDATVQSLLESAGEDWCLLLQLDTDDHGPSFVWDDCGRLYFMIRREDLLAGRFDRVMAHLQSS